MTTTTAPATVTGTIASTSGDLAVLHTVTGRDLIVPATEWYPERRWEKGQHVIAAVIDVGNHAVASVTTDELAEHLFTAHVPEIRDGRVRIMGIARAAGKRTKVAVAATCEGVDAVAACVGRGAARVRAMSNQLGGERLDVVSWDPDPATYLANALAPAKVEAVTLNDDGTADVTAPRHQMAAAVGEAGLNSQLAGELVDVDVTVSPA